MIDYFSFQAGAKYPTLSAVLYTVLLAFLLSTLISVTYYFTTPRSKHSRNFFQAMVLAAIVASTVMQAIGDSLAVGLGMMGALAIIRFRNNLEDPRDIIFMFAALAAGLACGVYGFTIALVGTIAFCVVAGTLKLTPVDTESGIHVRIRFQQQQGLGIEIVEQLLEKWSLRIRLEEVRIRETDGLDASPEAAATLDIFSDFDYKVQLRNQKAYRELINELQQVSTIRNLRINRITP